MDVCHVVGMRWRRKIIKIRLIPASQPTDGIDKEESNDNDGIGIEIENSSPSLLRWLVDYSNW